MPTRKTGSPKRAPKKKANTHAVGVRAIAKRVKPRVREEEKPKNKKKRPTPEPKRRSKPKPKPEKRRARTKAKKSAKRRARKSDKALRALIRDLGPAKAAKRLKKSARTIEGWQKRGVPNRSAAGVVLALERRKRGQSSFKRRFERQSEEWNERRMELLAQKNSPVTEAKNIVGVSLNTEGTPPDFGMALGWAPGGVLMRLYAVVSKETDDRRWFWTTAENLSGFEKIEEFIEFYDIEPEEYEVELWFGELLTKDEREAGGLLF